MAETTDYSRFSPSVPVPNVPYWIPPKQESWFEPSSFEPTTVWDEPLSKSEWRQYMGTRAGSGYESDYLGDIGQYAEQERMQLDPRHRRENVEYRSDFRYGFDPDTFNPARQLAETYPAIKRSFIPNLQRFGVMARQPRGSGGYFDPVNRYVALPPSPWYDYQSDPGLALHEYAHGMSIPGVDWARYKNDLGSFLAYPPEEYRFQADPFYQHGYGWDAPTEAYAEIARRAQGNLANVPTQLRRYYPWFTNQPEAR